MPIPGPGPLYRLQLDIDGFHGRYDGTARVSGAWRLWGRSGKLLKNQNFMIEKALAADGYVELVRALQNGWIEVTDALAEGIENASTGS